MNTIFLIFFFGFGLIIGSFLNVVLYRYNTGRGLWGRSSCFSCKRTLAPHDLVPVLSFLAYGAKCRTCKSHISWQYPAVELLTGILFAATYYMFASALFVFPPQTAQFGIQMVYGMIIMSLLVLIVVYDLRHKIIPDTFVFLFSALSFIGLFFTFSEVGQIYTVMPSVWDFASGIILAFPFYLLWLLSSGRWMGLGDAKLALGFGWFLGLSAGGTAIIFGFWIGAVVSLLMMGLSMLFRMFNKSRTFAHVTGHVLGIRFKLPHLSMRSEVPFAPFLVAGLLIVFFFGYNVFSF